MQPRAVDKNPRSQRDECPDGLEHRVPPLVLAPQLGVVFALAGDTSIARIGFILAVAGNVPIALTGRLLATGPLRLEPSRFGVLAEWARPAAAWGYSLLLAALLPYLDPSARAALIAAAAANAVAGALMYAAPGASTPAGLRLRQRQSSGVAWRHEAVVFVAARAARLLVPAAGGLLLVHLPAAALCLWAAVGAGLLASSLRPRNAAPAVPIRPKEKMR